MLVTTIVANGRCCRRRPPKMKCSCLPWREFVHSLFPRRNLPTRRTAFYENNICILFCLLHFIKINLILLFLNIRLTRSPLVCLLPLECSQASELVLSPTFPARRSKEIPGRVLLSRFFVFSQNDGSCLKSSKRKPFPKTYDTKKRRKKDALPSSFL